MSAGGMDWAYRMIGAHTFDGMEIAIVMHLGWRDHPNFRTDRAIARALNKDRKNVARVTAKLAARGVITRRSGQWVSCETVAIVTESADALRPLEPDENQGRGHHDPGVIRTPQEGSSGPRKRGHQDPAKRKEKKEKTRAARAASSPRRSAPDRPTVARPMGGGSGRSACVSENEPSVRPADPWQRAASSAALGLKWLHPESGRWFPASAFAGEWDRASDGPAGCSIAAE